MRGERFRVKVPGLGACNLPRCSRKEHRKRQNVPREGQDLRAELITAS